MNLYACGYKLVHNYNFLTGVDAAVTQTCDMVKSWYTAPELHSGGHKEALSSPSAFPPKGKKMSMCFGSTKQWSPGVTKLPRSLPLPIHATVPFCILSEVPEVKITAYFSVR